MKSPRLHGIARAYLMAIAFWCGFALLMGLQYVLLQREKGSHLLRESISTIAEKLRPYGFIRIHRSVLANTSFVQEIRPGITGEYLLRMRDGREYAVSRTYKKNLRSLAAFWIGTGAFLTG
jgi:LytTr DNA-binding domain